MTGLRSSPLFAELSPRYNSNTSLHPGCPVGGCRTAVQHSRSAHRHSPPHRGVCPPPPCCVLLLECFVIDRMPHRVSHPSSPPLFQFRKLAATSPPSVHQSVTACVMLYCREGLVAPPHLLSPLFDRQQQVAEHRLSALSACAAVLRTVTTDILTGASPAARAVACRVARDLLGAVGVAVARGGGDTGHYWDGTAGCGDATLRGIAHHTRAAATAAATVLHCPHAALWDAQVPPPSAECVLFGTVCACGCLCDCCRVVLWVCVGVLPCRRLRVCWRASSGCQATPPSPATRSW